MLSATRRLSAAHWGLVAASLWMVGLLVWSSLPQPALNISPVTDRYSTTVYHPVSGDRVGGVPFSAVRGGR